MKSVPRWVVRLAGWSLVVGTVLFWLCFVPADLMNLVRTAPPQADFISLHDRPMDRLISWANSPMARLLELALDLPPDSLATWIAQEPVQRWARRLADRQVMLASFPTASHARAWMLASRLGSKGIRFRWMFQMGIFPEFRRIGTHRGRTIWMLNPQHIPHLNRLTLTIEEGLILACWSENPWDIRVILDAFDGQPPRRRVPGSSVWAVDAGVGADRFWGRIPVGRNKLRLAGHIKLKTSHELTSKLWVYDFEWPELAQLPAGHGIPVEVGPSVGAVLHFDPRMLRPLAHRLPTPWLTEAALCLLSELRSPASMLLIDGEFAGRLWRLRTPALALLAQARDSPWTPDRLQARWDEVNRSYGTSLYLAPVAGTPPLWAVGTVSGSYANLRPEEQLAIYSDGSTIAIGTNLAALRSLVAAGAATRMPLGRAEGAETAEGAPAVAALSVSLEHAAATLRSAISVLSLALMFQDREGSRAIRSTLDQLREWVILLNLRGRLDVYVRPPHQGRLEVELTWCEIP